MFENAKKYHSRTHFVSCNDNIFTASILYSALIAMSVAVWKVFEFVSPTQMLLAFALLFIFVFGVICRMDFSVNRKMAVRLSLVIIMSIVCIVVF